MAVIGLVALQCSIGLASFPVEAAPIADEQNGFALSPPLRLYPAETTFGYEHSMGVPGIASDETGTHFAWLGVEPKGYVVRYAISKDPATPPDLYSLPDVVPSPSYGCCARPLISAGEGRVVVGQFVQAESLQLWTKAPNELDFARGALLSNQGARILVVDRDTVIVSEVKSNSLWLRASDDGGFHFGPPVDVSLAGKGVWNVSLINGPNRTVGACWDDFRNSEIPQPAPGANPDIYATVIDANLTSARRPIRVDDSGPQTSTQFRASCSFLPDGRMFVAWADGRTVRPGDSDIRAAVSNFTVTDFGPSIRLDDASNSEVSHQANPQVVSDDVGTAYVIFEDDRNFQWDLYYVTVRFSVSATMADPNALVAKNVGPGSEPRTSIDPHGIVFVSWRAADLSPTFAYGRSDAAGGNAPPGCEWMVPMHSTAPFGAISLGGRISDWGGSPADAKVTTTIDGTIVPFSRDAAYFWITVDSSQMENGLHAVTAEITDVAGARGSCSTELVVDPVGASRTPWVNVSSPRSDFTVDENFFIAGTAGGEDMQELEIHYSVDGGEWRYATGQEDWSALIEVFRLVTGSHSLAVIAITGNLTSPPTVLEFELRFPFPAFFPSCTIDFPPDRSLVANGTFAVGRVVDHDGLGDVLAAEYSTFPPFQVGKIDQMDSFTIELKIPDGTRGFILNVTVLDREGRRGGCGATFGVLAQPLPRVSVSITEPTHGSLVTGSFEIRGDAYVEGGIIAKVFVVIPGFGSRVAAGNSSWAIGLETAEFPTGLREVYAFAQSEAGAWSEAATVTLFFVSPENKTALPPHLVGIVSLDASRKLVEVAEEINFSVVVSNYGPEAASGIRLLIEAIPATSSHAHSVAIWEGELNLEANGSVTVITSIWNFSEPGEYKIIAQLDRIESYPLEEVFAQNSSVQIRVIPRAEVSVIPGTPVLTGLLLVATAVTAGILMARGRRSRRN